VYAFPDGSLFVSVKRKWADVYGDDLHPSAVYEVSLTSFEDRSIDEDPWVEDEGLRYPDADSFGRLYWHEGITSEVIGPTGERGPVRLPGGEEEVDFRAFWPDAAGFTVVTKDPARGVFIAQRVEWDPGDGPSGAFTVRETRECRWPTPIPPDPGVCPSGVGPWRAVYSCALRPLGPYRTFRVDFAENRVERLLDSPRHFTRIDRRRTLLSLRHSDNEVSVTIVCEGRPRDLRLPKHRGHPPFGIVPLFDRGLLSLDWFEGVAVITLDGRVAFTLPGGLELD
jgi:hypothetical protein